MAKSVMPKQTSGLSDGSEWDGFRNGEPQRLGDIGRPMGSRVAIARAEIAMRIASPAAFPTRRDSSALRDFHPVHVRFGSAADNTRHLTGSALPPKADE